jgi:carbamoylphosphate synthase large subunit
MAQNGTPGRDPSGHKRNMSSLSDFTLLELEHPKGKEDMTLTEHDLNESALLPKASLVILAETEKLEVDPDAPVSHGTTVLQSLAELDFHFVPKIKVVDWDGTKMYADYIKEGLIYNNKLEEANKTIMLFESPSCSTAESSFHNRDKFKFHDWPPPKSTKSKAILGPCRYALMNGPTYPCFLRGGAPPEGLLEHWAEAVPGVPMPRFAPLVTEEDTVYAYLPVEQIKNHVNDPDVHYHLAGKDAIHLMTQKTTKLLPDTRTSRPCVVKTTHSMGGKGIFIINNDEDEAEFEQFLVDSGNPTFVVTDFVDIDRNVACHFFMHPNGKDVTWMGSNENIRMEDGQFSSSSYLFMEDQEELKKMQLPFVEEVVQYCHSLGFWGFCGIDVLFDSKKRGHLVDINPRVTGSCPALMTLSLFKKKYGFEFGLFRRSGDINYYGSPTELLEKVTTYNADNEGKSRIVIHSMFEPEEGRTRVNIGVYGNDVEDCKRVLNNFAGPIRGKADE